VALTLYKHANDPERRAWALGCWGGLWGFAITIVNHALLVRGTGMLFIFFLTIVGTLETAERQNGAISESATGEVET